MVGELAIGLGLIAVAAALWQHDGGLCIEVQIENREGGGSTSSATASSASPPDEVIEFCAQESEQWAREDLMRRAQQLYRDLDSWDRVLEQLKLESRIVE